MPPKDRSKCGSSTTWRSRRLISKAGLERPASMRRESGQSDAGHVAPGFVHNETCGSAIEPSVKGDLLVGHPREERVLSFGKQFELWQAGRIAGPILRKLREALCEEAVAVSRDFQNEVRRHLIAPDVVIEELRIDLNLCVLLRGLGIGERRLRVQEMHPDVVYTDDGRR